MPPTFNWDDFEDAPESVVSPSAPKAKSFNWDDFPDYEPPTQIANQPIANSQVVAKREFNWDDFEDAPDVKVAGPAGKYVAQNDLNSNRVVVPKVEELEAEASLPEVPSDLELDKDFLARFEPKKKEDLEFVPKPFEVLDGVETGAILPATARVAMKKLGVQLPNGFEFTPQAIAQFKSRFEEQPTQVDPVKIREAVKTVKLRPTDVEWWKNVAKDVGTAAKDMFVDPKEKKGVAEQTAGSVAGLGASMLGGISSLGLQALGLSKDVFDVAGKKKVEDLSTEELAALRLQEALRNSGQTVKENLLLNRSKAKEVIESAATEYAEAMADGDEEKMKKAAARLQLAGRTREEQIYSSTIDRERYGTKWKGLDLKQDIHSIEHPDNQALVKRIRSGDAEALAKLIENISTPNYQYRLRREDEDRARKTGQLASDLLQTPELLMALSASGHGDLAELLNRTPDSVKEAAGAGWMGGATDPFGPIATVTAMGLVKNAANTIKATKGASLSQKLAHGAMDVASGATREGLPQATYDFLAENMTSRERVANAVQEMMAVGPAVGASALANAPESAKQIKEGLTNFIEDFKEDWKNSDYRKDRQQSKTLEMRAMLALQKGDWKTAWEALTTPVSSVQLPPELPSTQPQAPVEELQGHDVDINGVQGTGVTIPGALPEPSEAVSHLPGQASDNFEITPEVAAATQELAQAWENLGTGSEVDLQAIRQLAAGGSIEVPNAINPDQMVKITWPEPLRQKISEALEMLVPKQVSAEEQLAQQTEEAQTKSDFINLEAVLKGGQPTKESKARLAKAGFLETGPNGEPVLTDTGIALLKQNGVKIPKGTVGQAEYLAKLDKLRKEEESKPKLVSMADALEKALPAKPKKKKGIGERRRIDEEVKKAYVSTDESTGGQHRGDQETGTSQENREGRQDLQLRSSDGGGRGLRLALQRSRSTSSLRDALRAFGSEVLETSDGELPRAHFLADGTIVVKYDPARVLRDAEAKGNEEAGTTLIRDQFQEELIHAVHLSILRDRWKTSGKGSFDAYVRKDLGDLVGEIRDLASEYRSRGEITKAESIEQAMVDSWNLYQGNKDLSQPSSITTYEALIEHLDKKPRDVIVMAAELARQFVQLRADNLTTDTRWLAILNKIVDWVRESLFRLRQIARQVDQGVMGEILKRTVQDIESALEGVPALQTRETEGKPLFEVPKPSMESLRKLQAQQEFEKSKESGKKGGDNTRDLFKDPGSQGELFTRDTTDGNLGESNESRRNDDTRRSKKDLLKSAEVHLRGVRGVRQVYLKAGDRGEAAEIERNALQDLVRLQEEFRYDELISRNPLVDSGREHDVYLDQKTGLVFKVTQGSMYGATPFLKNGEIVLEDATPLEYIARWNLFNKVFNQDVGFEGLIEDSNGDVHIVISQPLILGTDPSKSEISDFLKKFGFQQVDLNKFYRPKDNVLAVDAHGGNFRKTYDGHTVPIDVILSNPEGELKKFLESPENGMFWTRETEPAIAPPFFSQLQRVIEKKMPNAASAGQIMGIVMNPQNGVKTEEIKWVGLQDFLQGKEKVTKQEVLDFLQQNEVKVEEVVKGTTFSPEKKSAIEKYKAEEEKILNLRDRGGQIGHHEADSRLKALRVGLGLTERDVSFIGSVAGETKFSQYQLPGGQNYRELLFTLPVRAHEDFDSFPEWAKLNYNLSKEEAWEDWENHGAASRAYIQAKRGHFSTTENFQSSHFDEPNVLAHVRFNERTDSDGKKVLFVEEVQSDWHQKGKKEGYKVDPSRIELLEKETQDAPKWLKAAIEASPSKNGLPDEHSSMADKLIELRDLKYALKEEGRVSDAPFKKTWHELVMKRMLRWAAESGSSDWNNITKPESVREMVQNFFGSEDPSGGVLSPVEISMLPLMNYEQVRDAVVMNLPVNVMNALASNSISTKKLVSNPNVVIQSLPADSRTTISLGIRNALKKVGTSLRTALTASLVAGTNKELLPTLKTSDIKPREVVWLTSPLRAGDLLSGDGGNLSTSNRTKSPSVLVDLTHKGSEPSSALLAEYLNKHDAILNGGKSQSIKYVPSYDKVAWTTGEQQAARYDLSKQVDKLLIQKVINDDKELYNVKALLPNRAYANEQTQVAQEVPIEKLSEYVGKDLAEKSKNIPAGGTEVFEGEGLKIGGVGMKGFYDQILPQFMAKYGKKWGAKVGGLEIAAVQEEDVMNGEEEEVGTFKAHSIDITPAMKESVLGEGQTLFTRETESTPAVEKQAKAGAFLGKEATLAAEELRKKLRGEMIPSAWQRLRNGGLIYKSTTDTLRKAGGRLSSLADKIDEYYDLNADLVGRLSKPFNDIVRSLKKADLKVASKEFEEYMKIRESGRTPEIQAEADALYAKMSDGGKKFVDAVKKMFVWTGKVNKQLNVHVIDPRAKGGWRPIGDFGDAYWPRILRRDVREALEDPDSNPKLYLEAIEILREETGIEDAEKLKLFIQQNLTLEVENKFFANLEMARLGKLPDWFYERGFEEVVPYFIASWAKRISQIKAFGQAIGNDKDAFQKAIEGNLSRNTQLYVAHIRDTIYEKRKLGWFYDTMAWLRTYTTASKLGNIWTSMRNASTIFVNTIPEFGLSNALPGLASLHQYGKQIRDAEEAGVLRSDLLAGMAEMSDFTELQQKIASVSLKLGGFSMVEKFTRSTAAAAGLNWARWGMKKVEANPKSQESLIFQAKLKKYGIDLEKLKKQGLSGNEGKKLMRAAANVTQFGYDMRQVPLWMENPAAKFLFQFQKFGIQMLRRVEVDILKPAIVGYEVDGKKVRDYRPLLLWLAFTAGTGFSLYWLRERLFGKNRLDASFEEISNTYNENELRGVSLILQRLFHDAVYAGGFGIIGDWASNMESVVSRGRAKSPLDPPSIGPFVNIWNNLIMRGWQQERLTMRDLNDFVLGEYPNYNYVTSLLKENAGPYSEQLVGEWKAAKIHAAKKDVAEIRRAGNRWAKELGEDLPPVGGKYPRTPNSPYYDRMQEALLIGDVDEAMNIKAEFIEASGDEQKAIRQLRSSVKGRQPIKVGGMAKEISQGDFEEWISRRVPSLLPKLRELDKTYQDSATAIGLW